MAYNLANHVNKRKALREQLDAITKQVGEKAKVMDAENRSFTAEELADIKGLRDQAEQLGAQIAALDNIAAVEGMTAVQAGIIPAGSPLAKQLEGQSQKTNYARTGKLKNFKTEAEAVRFGKWCLAAIYGNQPAKQWCEENGVPLQAVMTGSDNSKGGIFVPEEFVNTIIDLREARGVFRQHARVIPMSSETLTVPVRLSGLSAYWTADGAAVSTQSDKAWGEVELTAKELVGESRYTITLSEDALINIAEDLASEFAYSFANAEDLAGFNGDGSPTYGRINGLKNCLGTASVITAASTHTSIETLDRADYLKVRSKLPMFLGITPAWYVHKAVFEVSMSSIAYAAGGNTVREIAGGVMSTFFGDPVFPTQVLNSTLGADTSVIKAYYGDLNMAAMLGDRRSFSVRSSDQVYFRERQMLIQATSRLDIVVHQRGDSTNPGPILALKTAAG